MNATFILIMTACFGIIEPIMYVMLVNEAKPKKNLILGVTLPATAWTHPDVTAVLRKFKRNLLVCTLVMTALLFVMLLFPSTSVAMTGYLTWLLPAMILPFIQYARANRALLALKDKNGWCPPSGSDGSVQLVDTRAAAAFNRSVSGWWFFPPIVLSLLPALLQLARGLTTPLDHVMLWITLSITLIVVLFYISYRFLYRNQAEMVNDNTTLTIVLTRIRKQKWAICWLTMSWMSAVMSPIFFFFPENNAVLTVAFFIYSVVLIVVAIFTEFSLRSVQQRLTVDSTKNGNYVDDDRHWIYGMFYYNPDDKKLIKNNRTGMNTTINLARPAGRILMGVCALVIFTMPLWGVWMMVEDQTPVTLTYAENTLRAEHLFADYEIDASQIESAELLDALPDTSKIAGSNFENYFSGSFTVDKLGVCRLCLNPNLGKFLIVYTESEQIYLFTGETDAETAAVYDTLTQEVIEKK